MGVFEYSTVALIWMSAVWKVRNSGSIQQWEQLQTSSLILDESASQFVLLNFWVEEMEPVGLK